MAFASLMVFLLVMVVWSAYITWTSLRDELAREHDAAEKQQLLNETQRLDMELMAGAWKIEWSEIRLEKKMAAGAFGEVWRGVLQERFPCAIKKMFNTHHVDPDSDPEILFLKRVRHPRLVMFLGCGRMDSGQLFMVLEFCDGGDLTHFLYKNEGPPPSWANRVRLLIDTAHGVAYLHTVHFSVHRDLKSANVLLVHEGEKKRAKLADFGTSKRMANFSNAETAAKMQCAELQCAAMPVPTVEMPSNKTAAPRCNDSSGALRKSRNGSMEMDMTSATGTLCWMAPELIMRLNKDKTIYGTPADIYSYSMIMYEACQLKPPWYNINSKFTYLVCDAVLGEERPPVQQHMVDTTPLGYISLMRRCWATSPDQRPTVGVVARELRDIEAAIENDTKSLIPASIMEMGSGQGIELSAASATKHENPLIRK